MGVLPGAPIHAALVQLQETLRSERRGWGWKSLTRHHFAHVVQRRDGALKTRTVSVRIRPWAPTACSPMQRRSAQTGKVAGASPATRTNLECPPVKRAGPRCYRVRAFGQVVRVHGIPPCARSSKRAGGFIPRIALDQCRDPERYRTRVPFCPYSSKYRAGAS